MKPLIVANWKMNTTLSEAMILATGVKEGLANQTGAEVVLCPPFMWLVPINEILTSHRLPHLAVGAQNIFRAEVGAQTGEIAASMLKGVADYVIIGHSERRKSFHESDAEVAVKARLALDAALRPIVCVGELRKPSAEYFADPTDLPASQAQAILAQVDAVVAGLSAEQAVKIIIAYEPVWAISTNKDAVPANGHYANHICGLIRHRLKKKVGGAADSMRILYGGSANPENAAEFLHQPEIGGLLVGGASLKVKSFLSVCGAI